MEKPPLENFFAGVEHRWPAGEERYHWHALLPAEVLNERLYAPTGA